MAKKALCVGINDYPGDGSDLNGCVNDAKAWAQLLIDQYGFAKNGVTVLTDAQATKANIMAGIKKLLAGAKSGDVLVFQNSSHGTYVADEDADEERFDEALCPYDCADNLIVDDELRGLFGGIGKGVSLTVIADNCHSGTVTRAAVAENLPGMRTPDDRRVRFLHPSLIGRRGVANPWSRATRAASARTAKYPESKMKDVLLAGCTPNEYSYDALIDGTYHGAMTFYALQAIKAADYRITYAQLHARLRYLLDANGYPQHPQLEGNAQNKKKQIFS
ncbi:MAG TPA: caspase family protein [Rhodocyclaceae bacterium]|jgi:hypothetical protein|nr:caspase family protein [Rhodocyclaceae bacterium]